MTEDHASTTLGDSERAPDTKHTPGPWKAELARLVPEAELFGFAIRADGKNPSICGAAVYEHDVLMLAWPADAAPHPDAAQYFTPREVEANARLIAAAPDLLAALKLLWDEVVQSGNGMANDYGWRAARVATLAAIQKAEGAQEEMREAFRADAESANIADAGSLL